MLAGGCLEVLRQPSNVLGGGVVPEFLDLLHCAVKLSALLLVTFEKLWQLELQASFAEEFEALVRVFFSVLSPFGFNKKFHHLEFKFRVGVGLFARWS